MRIKDFAKKYEVSEHTIRYYEKERILLPKRTENGYREFDETTEKQLQLILVLKDVGFTLDEMKALFVLQEKPVSTECNRTSTALFENKIDRLNEKIVFYERAVQALVQIKSLMENGKFKENEAVIENLVLALFQRRTGDDEHA